MMRFAHALEDNAARLTAQGYDVTVAALEETQRKISPMPAPPVEKAKRIIRHFYTDDFGSTTWPSTMPFFARAARMAAGSMSEKSSSFC